MSAMMPALLTAQIVPAFVCILLGVAMFMLRASAVGRNKKRLWQLEKSAGLLDIHAQQLGVFLDDPSAPVLLKKTALLFADFMDDRCAVYEFASWMSAQPLGNSVSDEETLEIVQQFDRLGRDYPNLSSAFSSAILCGAFGAILRWPESAKLFDLSVPAMVADKSPEVAAAIRAAKMHGAPLLDFRTKMPAPEFA